MYLSLNIIYNHYMCVSCVVHCFDMRIKPIINSVCVHIFKEIIIYFAQFRSKEL